MPPFGLVCGWLAFDESVAMGDMIGIVPIAIGIWLATRKSKHKKAAFASVQKIVHKEETNQPVRQTNKCLI